MLRKLYFTMIIMWQVIFIETVWISIRASPLSECDGKTLKSKLRSSVHQWCKIMFAVVQIEMDT